MDMISHQVTFIRILDAISIKLAYQCFRSCKITTFRHFLSFLARVDYSYYLIKNNSYIEILLIVVTYLRFLMRRDMVILAMLYVLFHEKILKRKVLHLLEVDSNLLILKLYFLSIL